MAIPQPVTSHDLCTLAVPEHMLAVHGVSAHNDNTMMMLHSQIYYYYYY